MSNERRKFFRHPMCFPLKYRVVNKGLISRFKEEAVSTKNINQGGLLFCSKNPTEVGAIISIKIPFQAKIFNVKAKVVHCTPLKNSDLFDVGVSFLRHNEAFKVKLIEQLYLISEYRDLTSVQLGREISLEEASREWIKRYSKRFARLYW